MRVIVYLLLLLIPLGVSAQDSLQLSVSPEKIKIGQQAQLKLQLYYQADNGSKDMVWPSFSDTLQKNIEIISLGKISKKPTGKGNSASLLQEQIITITSFDSGYYAIPPMHVIINSDTLYSNPVLLEVHTVDVDTTKEIKGIKGIYETELSWDDFWFSVKNWFKDNLLWIILVLLVIIGLIIYLVYLKRRKTPEEKKPEVIIPAHITALEKLTELESKKMWQNGFMKEYYIELTTILRIYIEARFRIHAMEQTTEEIMTQLRLTDISEVSKLTLLPVLRLSDLVKFAKENPIGLENDEMLQRAKDFVISTIPKVNPATENKNDGI